MQPLHHQYQRTEPAAIGGVAIGTVDRIEWAMGAGESVSCKGSGTPFTRAMAVGKSFSRSIPLQITDLRPVLVDPNGGSSMPSVPPRSCGN
ncbi:hypothetical protein [Kribbella sp. NPDC055071]